jgi:rod shape-determining protein MreD
VLGDRFATAWRLALVLFTAVLLQVAVMSDLTVMGQSGDLVLLVAVAAGSVSGPDRGATFGFAAGLAYDLLLVDTPFGLNALVYALVGYGVGVVAGWVIQPRWWFHLVTAVVATAVAVALTAVVTRVLGRPFPLDDLAQAAGVEAAWGVALIVTARRALRWVAGEDRAEAFRVGPVMSGGVLR